VDAYRQWMSAAIPEDELQAIRGHLAQERALGNPRFQAMVEKNLNRPALCRDRGRPERTALASI
jgi:putative transposase